MQEGLGTKDALESAGERNMQTLREEQRGGLQKKAAEVEKWGETPGRGRRG